MDNITVVLAPKKLEIVSAIIALHQWFPEMVTPIESEVRKRVARGHYYLAYHDNELIGLSCVEKGWDGVLFLHELGVREDYRRKGVAKMLLHKSCRISPIQVFVSRYNQDFQAFLKSQGFYVSGQYSFPKPEGLIMFRHASMADRTGYL